MSEDKAIGDVLSWWIDDVNELIWAAKLLNSEDFSIVLGLESIVANIVIKQIRIQRYFNSNMKKDKSMN